MDDEMRDRVANSLSLICTPSSSSPHLDSTCLSFSRAPSRAQEDEHEQMKMMDGEEGQVHALHLEEEMDEEIDWYEPQRELLSSLGSIAPS